MVPIWKPSRGKPSSSATRSISVAAQRRLARVRDQRDHDLQARRLVALGANGGRGAEDRAHLHLVDLGMDQPEPHAAGAEHRVALGECLDALERVLEGGRIGLAAQARLGDLLDELDAVGHELVQRRVEQPDRDRQAGHGLAAALRSRPAGAAAARRARRGGRPRPRP